MKGQLIVRSSLQPARQEATTGLSTTAVRRGGPPSLKKTMVCQNGSVSYVLCVRY